MNNFKTDKQTNKMKKKHFLLKAKGANENRAYTVGQKKLPFLFLA